MHLSLEKQRCNRTVKPHLQKSSHEIPDIKHVQKPFEQNCIKMSKGIKCKKTGLMSENPNAVCLLADLAVKIVTIIQ